MRLKARLDRVERAAAAANASRYENWTVEQVEAEVDRLLAGFTPDQRAEIMREIEELRHGKS